jgi:hypothetical protein
MTIRTTIAAVALSSAALLSGTAFAGDFAAQLSEAKVASQTAEHEVRQAVVPALNAAYGLNAIGAQDQAQDQLTFARNKLGLSTSPAIVATPVVASPMGRASVGSFEEQLNEAKVASLTAAREIREAVAAQIDTAQALNAQGNQASAEDHLNFARGKLGLTVAAQAQSRAIADIYLPPSAR